MKHLWYDSFGNLWKDTRPDLFIPIGFAGGLADRDTGLVRFGYRDYDSSVGQSTSPDPAQDRRGDGDIYDYCVDDPVSLADPAGLNWVQAALGAASLVQQARPHISRVAAAARPYAQAALRGVQGAGQAVANGVQSVAQGVANGAQRVGQGIVNTSQTLINTGLAAGRTVERGVTQAVIKGKEVVTQGAQKAQQVIREADIASNSMRVAPSTSGKAAQIGTMAGNFARGAGTPFSGNASTIAEGFGVAAERAYANRDAILAKAKDVGDAVGETVKTFQESMRKRQRQK